MSSIEELSMTDFQQNKALVRCFSEQLDAPGSDIAAVLARYTTNDYLFRGLPPIPSTAGCRGSGALKPKK